jgi:hypothetical protein
VRVPAKGIFLVDLPARGVSGKGVVGGPMISGAAVSHQAASVAARILAGEHASDIKTPPIHLSHPRYDWRELKRWNIKQSKFAPRKRNSVSRANGLGTISLADSVRYHLDAAWSRTQEINLNEVVSEVF